MIEITRDKHLAEEILFIDGSWGTGKSILGPVLGSFDRVEKQKIDHIFEYVATLDYLGKIQRDAAKSLLGMYADIDLFNSLISREVNLRWNDDSGILNNPKAFSYIKRLFMSDGDIIKSRIGNERPILQIMSHHLLHVADSIFDTFGNRVKFVEMVRHPVYMVSHWYNYLHRVGADEREFNIWLKGNNQTLPWFIENETEFNELNRMDRVIYSLSKLDAMLDSSIQKHRENILVIPFELFVTDPNPFVTSIQTFLNAKPTSALSKVLRRQKVPRKVLSAGRGHKSYGWSEKEIENSDVADYQSRLDFVAANATPIWVDRLLKLGAKYQATYKVAGIGPWAT
ncbi:MAG: hypothetical protein V4736_08610 [Bdellovibrionota bacterium]